MAVKTGAKRHTHRYHKLGNQWHCSLPDCTHFMPGNVAENIIGKKSICWNCGKEFILDEISLQNERPVCANCGNELVTAGLDEFLKSKGV
jgi:formylmethanofuran dehydrogenase subunit E